MPRIRLAIVSCANYPAGYFNPYRCVANRDDLDAVVHLGDYIYEFQNGIYGDGSGAAAGFPSRARETGEPAATIASGMPPTAAIPISRTCTHGTRSSSSGTITS